MSQLSAHDKAVLNCVFNPNLPLEEAVVQHPEELHDEVENTPEFEKVTKLELDAIEAAEKGNLNEGLVLINDAIEISPKRPSLYNNRAHIFQFMRKFDEALKDTTTAIDLATDKHKKTLCNAHCQRGILYRRADQIELARSDFEVAVKMGNQFAKGQLVELNPYAALCNQMLRQVMDTLK